ncbi:MAG: asparagine--tRNA ligase [Candidatus Marinimicrobia bacterium]|nr:asparagine--tRNA ligase [Candidatus Neomarinimicrobiota bacterium]MCF7830056.1 asparagine--tRNA ligase [Candidatus Neomarinimicrobiota bacterium]MCF7882357.1 asparagine--tRNA ligase [Candidatus Neomarinimicrobiota bacterium]
MDHVYIKDLKNHVGDVVTIKGWVYNTRSSGKIWFLLTRDGTGIVQGVALANELEDEVFDLYSDLSQESSVIVKGEVQKDDRAPGGYELLLKDVQMVNQAVDYPITPKEHGVTFLQDHRHLWIRSSQQHALLKIRHEVINACRDFFNSRDFLLFDAPMFTPNAVEGTTTLFETEYFGEKAYLTQSGQLYGEAGAMAFGKVYVFGPTFRAEKSKTRRHLTEFWMVEPEMAYYDLNDNMDLAEEFVEYVVQRTLEECRDELRELERDVSKLENIHRPFPRITYTEAVELLHEHDHDFEWGGDFGAPDEQLIAEQYDKPVMVHRYPADVKAFYMKRDPEDEKLALGVDMLAPEGYGEIIGGGQREDDYDTLVKRIEEHGLPQDPFEWYLDLRRYGSVPHSGFGMGIERAIAWISGVHHLRETIPFPRTISRLEP